MLTAEENDLLCRVEGDAPMGQIMRRHWIPACMSEEVAEPDGAPVRCRLLGEDLVVFRDSDGRLGVLDEYCPHRRASLAFGRNEECGLRCLYHGWKMDVEGNVLEMASEPHESSLIEKVKHKAYPAREAGGFVWTYMGPSRPDAGIRAAGVGAHAATNGSVSSRSHVAANWAQIIRGRDRFRAQLEPAFDRHAAGAGGQARRRPRRLGRGRRPTRRRASRLQRTNFGFRYAAIRRPIINANTHDYVRITLFVAPFTALIPPNDLSQLSLTMLCRSTTPTPSST